MSYLRTYIVLVALPALACADTITFKNGSRLEGIATVRGDTLEVRVPEGSLYFARSLVADIAQDTTPLAEYEKRLKSLPAKEAKASYELALFCEAHGMRSQAEALFKQTVALAPTHEGARGRLGYRKVGDRWVTSSELLSELGLVQVKGEWMTPRAAREMAELDERTRRLESRLATIEKDSSDLKRTVELERRITDKSERYTDGRLQQLESENRRLKEQPPVYYYGGWPYGYVTTTNRRGSGFQTTPRRSTSTTAFGIPPVNKTIVIP